MAGGGRVGVCVVGLSVVLKLCTRLVVGCVEFLGRWWLAVDHWCGWQVVAISGDGVRGGRSSRLDCSIW